MLKTEMRNEHTMHIDKMTSGEMVAAMARENYRAAGSVKSYVLISACRSPARAAAKVFVIFSVVPVALK